MTAWDQVRLKYLADINRHALPEDTPPDTEFRYLDISACGRGHLVSAPESMTFGSAPSRARRVIQTGDTIVSTVRTYLRAVWAVEGRTDDLVVSTGFAVLSPKPVIDARYLAWLVQSDTVIEEIVARSVGVSYPAINAADIGEIPVALPDLREQRAIADYLDAETAHIDASLGALRRLRSVLEQRWMTILDTEVLGQVGARSLRRSDTGGGAFDAVFSSLPRDWTARPLKAVLERNDSGVWGEDPTGAGDTIVIRSTEIAMDGTWSIDEAATRSLTPLEVRAGLLQEDDIVVVTSSGSDQHIGKAAIVTEEVARLRPAFSNFTQRLRVSLEADAHFIWFFLRSPIGREQLTWLSSTTTGLRNLSGRVLGQLRYPGPPLAEQARIAQRLETLWRDTRRTLRTIDRQADLLVERRQAVIAAAVTGKLTLSGAAA